MPIAAVVPVTAYAATSATFAECVDDKRNSAREFADDRQRPAELDPADVGSLQHLANSSHPSTLLGSRGEPDHVGYGRYGFQRGRRHHVALRLVRGGRRGRLGGGIGVTAQRGQHRREPGMGEA